MRGIAGKLLLNHRRQLGRNRVHFCDERVLGFLDEGFRSFEAAPGDTFDEQLDVLRDCLDGLTSAQRDSIRLHYEHGLHCREIAQRLDMNFEAVKKHLQRGRAVLHRCLTSKLEAGEVA